MEYGFNIGYLELRDCRVRRFVPSIPELRSANYRPKISDSSDSPSVPPNMPASFNTSAQFASGEESARCSLTKAP
jgi:hypothetical protein